MHRHNLAGVAGIATAALVAAAASGCTSHQPPSPAASESAVAAAPDAAAGPAADPAAAHVRFADVAWLETRIVRLRAPDGNNLVIFSRISNPYDEDIRGVRVYLGLHAAGADRRLLASFAREFDTRIPAHSSVPLRIELATHHAKVSHGIEFHAFGMQRGDQVIAAPADLASDGTAADIQIMPSVPYPSTPVDPTGGLSF
jgi:hypothetical protein